MTAKFFRSTSVLTPRAADTVSPAIVIVEPDRKDAREHAKRGRPSPLTQVWEEREEEFVQMLRGSDEKKLRGILRFELKRCGVNVGVAKKVRDFLRYRKQILQIT